MTPPPAVIPIESVLAFRYLREAEQRGVPESVLLESYRKLVADDLATLTRPGAVKPLSQFELRGYLDFEVDLDRVSNGVRIRATRRDRQGKDCGQGETVVHLPDVWRHPDLRC